MFTLNPQRGIGKSSGTYIDCELIMQVSFDAVDDIVLEEINQKYPNNNNC
jgi:hypothetical protein